MICTGSTLPRPARPSHLVFLSLVLWLAVTVGRTKDVALVTNVPGFARACCRHRLGVENAVAVSRANRDVAVGLLRHGALHADGSATALDVPGVARLARRSVVRADARARSVDGVGVRIGLARSVTVANLVVQ